MRRLSARPDGRVLCLFFSTLTLFLGLGLVGAGLAGAGASLDVVAAKSVPIAAAIPLSTVTTPHVVTDHLGSALRCQPEPPRTSPPDTMDRTPHEDDPRVYLSKMAAWHPELRLTSSAALDPYQASLHLGHGAGDFTIAAAPGHHGLLRGPSNHRC